MSADIHAAMQVNGAQGNVPVQHTSPERAPKESASEKAEAVVRETSQESAERSQKELAQKTKEATEQLNDIMGAFNKGIRFQIHDGTDRPYVEVVNKKTHEVMRTWPPEELLDVMARLHDALGIILDTSG